VCVDAEYVRAIDWPVDDRRSAHNVSEVDEASGRQQRSAYSAHLITARTDFGGRAMEDGLNGTAGR